MKTQEQEQEKKDQGGVFGIMGFVILYIIYDYSGTFLHDMSLYKSYIQSLSGDLFVPESGFYSSVLSNMYVSSWAMTLTVALLALYAGYNLIRKRKQFVVVFNVLMITLSLFAFIYYYLVLQMSDVPVAAQVYLNLQDAALEYAIYATASAFGLIALLTKSKDFKKSLK
jgi:hypothetical protein